MALYLVQHGKSLPKEKDPEKGLSAEGVAEVERIAQVAQGYGVQVLRIRHSGKKRARQTAEILAAALQPKYGMEQGSGLQPLDPVEPIASQLASDENLMIVGHLPFLEKLTSYLILKDVQPRVFRFQNGGIVCLDVDSEHGQWHIKWTLMPYIG